ncbi:MAG: hypothetical protein HY275_02045, partial [Gemmatimonadetes bacterium]|nr:hypothetical protein [Gemmatimonadota bacterium]
TMLAEAMGKWQGVPGVPDERLYPALKRAGIAPGSVIEAARVRKLAEETGGWTAVTGEVLATGGRLRVTARAIDVPTNKELVRASGEVPTTGDVRVAFDSVSLRLLRAAGLDSLTSDLSGTTTRNLDAYKSYLSGLAHLRRSEIKLALGDFESSVKADSTFALAWARLSEVQLATEPLSIMQPGSKGSQYAARAVSLAASLPPRQRQLVLANDAVFRAQYGDARRIIEGLVAADSNDVEALQHLVDLESFDPMLVTVKGGERPRGSPARATRLAKRAVELDPSRATLYGTLASLYAQAGMSNGQPALAVTKVPTSMQDLLSMVRQPGLVRLYAYVLRDSLGLVPRESLSFIPKDTLRAMRKTARAAAIAWAQRWAEATAGSAAPYQLLAELQAMDGDARAGLRSLAKAESIGVQTPAWSAPARRLTYLARAGDLAAASRLADSLTSANFFRNLNTALLNPDAAAWAFALHLWSGRLAMVGTMIEQRTALARMTNPDQPAPSQLAFVVLMGNEDPEDEPGIPRSLRRAVLDSGLAHVEQWAAVDKLRPWLGDLLPMLAEAADKQAPRSGDLLKAAQTLAAAGRDTLAWELAYSTVSTDTLAAIPAATYPFFRKGAEALNASREARKARFRPATATLEAERLVFEWTVQDAQPFTWNLPETPSLGGEYRFESRVQAGNKAFVVAVLSFPKRSGLGVQSGTLAQLLDDKVPRFALSGTLDARGAMADTTRLQSVRVQTEIAPGALRVIVTDRAILDALRASRPKEALFRLLPCPQPIGVPRRECASDAVAITYK